MIATTPDQTFAPLRAYKLEDTARQVSAIVVPERGGLVATFEASGAPVLYLDEATLRDPAASVRGGAPVLFPSPGKLHADVYARGGVTGRLPQHGFARRMPWEVLPSRGAEDAGAIRMRLVATPETRRDFPFDFEVEHTVRLDGGALRIDQVIANRGGAPMPFAFGFHPYFAVPLAAKGSVRFETEATRAFDNVTKRAIPYAAPRFDAGEVDLHVEDHEGPRARLAWEGGAVQIDASPEYARWILWTLPGKPFVCLEPWTSPADALNSGEGLVTLAPGARKALFVTLRGPMA